MHKFIVTFRNIFFQFKMCEKYMYFDYMGPCTVNMLGSSWQNIDVTILWCFLISVRHYAKLFKNALQCSLASVCEEFGMQTSNNASKKASLSSELHSSHCLFVFVSGVLILVSFGAEKRTLNIFELMLNYIIHALFYKAKKTPVSFITRSCETNFIDMHKYITNTLQIQSKKICSTLTLFFHRGLRRAKVPSGFLYDPWSGESADASFPVVSVATRWWGRFDVRRFRCLFLLGDCVLLSNTWFGRFIVCYSGAINTNTTKRKKYWYEKKAEKSKTNSRWLTLIDTIIPNYFFILIAHQYLLNGFIISL